MKTLEQELQELYLQKQELDAKNQRVRKLFEKSEKEDKKSFQN